MFTAEPIKNLKNKTTYAYELLYRGTDLNKELLFQTISEELDFEIFKKAILWLKNNQNDHYLYFVNIKPNTLAKKAFEIIKMIHNLPCQVVIEIREDQINKENEKILAEIRKDIFISLDDFGAKSSNFDRMLDLTPEFIKIDIQLFKKTNKSSLLLLTESIRKAINTTIIAEKIETLEDYSLALNSGIKLGQGYLLV